MGELLDFFTGWAGFFTLAFYGKTVLLIAGGAGMAIVARAALRSRRRWWMLLVVVLPVYAVIGILLAVAIEIL